VKCLLSVLIVHYNTPDLLRQCLASIAAAEVDFSFEVIVIDNASPDVSVKTLAAEFPRVIFHFNSGNLGFARANNQGIQMGQGRYYMLLNPDACIDADGISGLTEFMENHPDAGATGPMLVYPDGELQLSCRRFPTFRTLLLRMGRLDRLVPGPVRHYLMQDWDHQSVSEVDWVIGACMILRREALDRVGLLDEDFFMYYEDIDLCLRLWQGGWKVYYNPEVTVRHEHQRSSAALLPNRLTYEHARSLFYLFGKHRLAWW
jgi:GT2 family glycosyltransferase